MPVPRLDTCHRPVRPGFTRWRWCCHGSYRATISTSSGRGPTRLMSPRTTFQNWGSSSRLHFRRNRPTRCGADRRRSCGSGDGPDPPARAVPAVVAHRAELVDVELLVTVRPTRRWRKKTGEPSESRTATATTPVQRQQHEEDAEPDDTVERRLDEAHVDPVRRLDDHVIGFGGGDGQPSFVRLALRTPRRARDRCSSCWPRHFFDRATSAPEAFPPSPVARCPRSACAGEPSTERGRTRGTARSLHTATIGEWRCRASVRTSRSWRVVIRAS